MSISSRAVSAFFGLALLTVAVGVQGFDPGAASRQQPAGQPTTQPAAGAPQQQPAAQQQSADQQPTTIRRGINYVSVDVIVTDKDGKQVLDLTQNDFTVAEDGKPQTIDNFSIVKIDALETMQSGPPRQIRDDLDEEREAARPDVRLFVILLDDYHVQRGNDLAVKKPLIDFIENQLAPADMIAIMYPLSPITDLRFSRNPKPRFRRSNISRDASSTTGRATSSKRSTRTIRPRWLNACAIRSRWTP